MDAELWLAFGAALVLTAAHLGAARLGFIRLEPRSQVLSAAGGVSVAYVFVHLLPEIAEAQEAIGEVAGGAIASIERHAYLFALVGLVVFYGLERAAVASRGDARRSGGEATAPGIFWISTISFAVYNALIGYLLLERSRDSPLVELVLFALALALHMVVNDLGLRGHHKSRYDRWGRWILAAAPLVGVAVAAGWEISEAALGLVIAFLGGGIVLNVLKEELPEERESRFGAFLAGAAAYGALLLLV